MFASGIVVMVVGFGMMVTLGLTLGAEQFETRVRYSGTAIASQLGLIVEGLGPTIAAAIVRPGPGGWLPVATFTAACCVVAALVTLLWVRETHKVATEDLGKSRGA